VTDQFQPVKSADRTLEILEALGSSPERHSLGDLARMLSIPKSSLHAILRTMAQRGWVETDPTGLRFGIGMRALLVGATYVESDDVAARVQPVLDWLNVETDETTHLGRLDGADVVYLAKRESTHPLRMYSAIGKRLPAHATALGKAMLATYSDAQVAEILPATLARLTPHTITGMDELLAELADIRSRGYTVDHEENSENIRCFAVSLGTAAPATDAVSVSVPTFRLSEDTEQRIIEMLGEVNDRLLTPHR
jgi:DNA-binding IclR family transcriptional regulator